MYVFRLCVCVCVCVCLCVCVGCSDPIGLLSLRCWVGMVAMWRLCGHAWNVCRFRLLCRGDYFYFKIDGRYTEDENPERVYVSPVVVAI